MKPDNKMQTGALLLILVATFMVVMPLLLNLAFDRAVNRILSPITNSNQMIQTQVAQVLHPTPTVLPDPVTIIHEVRSLARLETVRYSMEKIITAEVGQGAAGFLFGDKLLFVAHATVIAGVDLDKLDAGDMWLDDGVLKMRLPEAEIFIVALDNDKSYVYDRETGLLSKGNINLETAARQSAEDEIEKAALGDGILNTAQSNAEAYLSRLLRGLGYPEVIFIE